MLGGIIDEEVRVQRRINENQIFENTAPSTSELGQKEKKTLR